VPEEDAVRWFQFKQKPEARNGLEVSAQVRTARRRIRPNITIRAFHALHALPIVFVLGATKKTNLIVVAVSGSPRPEKLVGAGPSIRTLR